MGLGIPVVVGTNTYGTGAPFGPAGGGDRTKSGSRRSTRAILPSFGALRRDKTPTAALCFYLLESVGML